MNDAFPIQSLVTEKKGGMCAQHYFFRILAKSYDFLRTFAHVILFMAANSQHHSPINLTIESDNAFLDLIRSMPSQCLGRQHICSRGTSPRRPGRRAP
jgi:hypothetical protein